MTPITSFSWLVFAVEGGEFICGRAQVHRESDLITVSAYGQQEATQLGGGDPQWLAWRLLIELARRAARL